MENQEKKVEVAEEVVAAPTSDSKNRLAAAREYAVAQYEKIRRAAAAQFDHVRKYTQEARAQINEGWDVTCNKAKDLHKAGEEYVKAHPTGTVLGGFGLGIIIGLLLGSSRR
ncbi:MAG: hypothetical protein E7031_08975 [Akkermansiaceae bacterium]|nr:hypothetical protein [Akkermansiaceae bacterium]